MLRSLVLPPDGAHPGPAPPGGPAPPTANAAPCCPDAAFARTPPPCCLPTARSVVFPLLCFDDEDAELWEDDPQEYIRKVGGGVLGCGFKRVGRMAGWDDDPQACTADARQVAAAGLRTASLPSRCAPATQCTHPPAPPQGYDIMEDIYSTRTAAMSFLHELCKARPKGNLEPLMAVGTRGWVVRVVVAGCWPRAEQRCAAASLPTRRPAYTRAPPQQHLVGVLNEYKAAHPGAPAPLARRMDGALLALGTLADVLKVGGLGLGLGWVDGGHRAWLRGLAVCT